MDSDSLESAWNENVQLLRDRLRVIIERPEVAHSLFVASPSLQAGIEHWKLDPNSKKGIQAERALVRYFARMCGRSTPFGLFSGCSVGQVISEQKGVPTSLRLQARQAYQPVSRLDFDYLCGLTTNLSRNPDIAIQLRYWPNVSLYKFANVWHYVESRVTGAGRSHHDVKAESDEFLDTVIFAAKEGASVPELVNAIVSLPSQSETSEQEVKEYIQELISNDVLVSNLAPRITEDPLDDIIEHLETLPAGKEIADTLASVRESMAALDEKRLGVPLEHYEKIATRLKSLPAKVDPSKLFQIDMTKPVERAVLTAPVVDELVKGVELLARMGKLSEPEPLRSFREAFTARYELARIPLLEALSAEAGIGFGDPSADSSPVLRGLRFGGGKPGGQAGGGIAFEQIHSLLLRKVTDSIRDGVREIELQKSDLPADGSMHLLANSFALNATIVAKSDEALAQGDFEIRLRSAVGPSGARFFGRFCHTDPRLDRYVKDYVRQEELHDPEAVYAEIVYSPEGRVGNVLSRPVLRKYEVVFLGRSGAPAHCQIPASDLLISVESGNITLYSERLGRRIIPRLTNAHGFSNPAVSPVYRFLCLLQHQHGVSSPYGFGWGPLEAMDYLPRLRMGRLILTPARWRVDQKEIAAVTSRKKNLRFIAIQELRRQRGLPRWILLEEADNTLPVDLDNPLSIDAFVHVLKRLPQAILREMCPSPDEICATGPEGRFYHEINVPFIRRPPKDKPSVSTRRTHIDIPHQVRHRALGSDWMFVKIYGGPATLDEILATTVWSLVRESVEAGIIASWFFVRYSDPHYHHRIRFRGDPNRLHQLSPQLSAVLNPLLASRKIWKIQWDTYDREIERYGGPEGMAAAEELFCADSDAVLETLQQLEGDAGLNYRWQTAIIGLDALLNDSGLDLEAKREMMRKLRPAENLRKILGDRFRSGRKELEALLESSGKADTILSFARNAFKRRSLRLRSVFSQLRSLDEAGALRVSLANLVPSYLHMHVNRLMRYSPNQHETVLYDYMFRLYDGQLARGRNTKESQEVGAE